MSKQLLKKSRIAAFLYKITATKITEKAEAPKRPKNALLSKPSTPESSELLPKSNISNIIFVNK